MCATPQLATLADTMAPGASSDCTKACTITSDAPTTSPIAPSHRSTRSAHGESPRAIPEKRHVLTHPRPCTLHMYPYRLYTCVCVSGVDPSGSAITVHTHAHAHTRQASKCRAHGARMQSLGQPLGGREKCIPLRSRNISGNRQDTSGYTQDPPSFLRETPNHARQKEARRC